MADANVAGHPLREGWDAVALTQARQVAAAMDRDPEAWPDGQGARAGYDALRRAGALSAAAEYLAHALPRLEAIAWAARVVEGAALADPPGPRRRDALDVALRWLDEPSDAHRRAARAAAAALREPGPEQHLGNAVFYSGGSIGAPGQPPMLPPAAAAARYALAAIRACAYRTGDPDAAFARALDLGERIAARGLVALDR